MHILVTDFGVRHGLLVGRLASAGLEVGLARAERPLLRVAGCVVPGGVCASEAVGQSKPSLLPWQPLDPRPGVVIAALSPGDDVACLRAFQEQEPASPLVVVARAAVAAHVQVQDLGITVMFPGFDASEAAEPPGRSRGLLSLPGTVVGPLTGRPRSVDQWFAEVLRQAGIRASCRGDMQSWLTVTSAWLSPLRGAVIAAAQQGLTLRATPDLVTLATRAARERLSLLRSSGFDLNAGCACLVALPEWWAIRTMRRIAWIVPPDGSLWCLPTAGEAVVVSRSLAALARESGIHTPAADFLDAFSLEEAGLDLAVRGMSPPEAIGSASDPDGLARSATPTTRQ